MFRATISLIILFLSIQLLSQDHTHKIKGITYVLGKDTSCYNDLLDIKNLNCEWIALTPFAYCEAPNFIIDQDTFNNWKALTANGILHTIKQAHKLGLKVLLKPQLYVKDAWPGIIDFKTEKEWRIWEEQYEEFIFGFLQMAIVENVEMFCIGHELSQSQTKRHFFWKRLLTSSQKKYKGLLVYSSNWDSYTDFKYWNLCDFICISSYFPLTDKVSPSIDELKKKWQPIKKELRQFSVKKGKALLFLEFGYHSVQATADRHWIIEEQLSEKKISQQEQALAFDALFSIWCNEPIWKGGFIWKWYPKDLLNELDISKDYSPQNKKAMDIIKKWFIFCPE